MGLLSSLLFKKQREQGEEKELFYDLFVPRSASPTPKKQTIWAMPKRGAITIIRQAAPRKNTVGPSFLSRELQYNHVCILGYKEERYDSLNRSNLHIYGGRQLYLIGIKAVEIPMKNCCNYVGVSESKVPYFFATKILHIIRCLFLQLLLTSFTIFSRSHLLC